MAGVCSRDSCRGCSSTSCACDDKGTWSEPSLLSQRLLEDSSRHQLLQRWTSMWNSLSGDASVTCAERTQRKEAAEPAEEEDRPLVFLCSGCRRPLGDSLSWVTSQEDTNSILLRCELPARGLRTAFFQRTAPGAGRVLWGCPRTSTAEKSGRVSRLRKRGRGGSLLHLGLTSHRSFFWSSLWISSG